MKGLINIIKNNQQKIKLFSLFLLIGILMTFFYIRNNNTNSKEEIESDNSILNQVELTPTMPPNTLPRYLYYNGELILLSNLRHIMVSEMIQEKIDASEFIGLTVEPVSGSKFPTVELQTNFMNKNYSIYFFNGEEQIYIFMSDDPFYCSYCPIN